MIPRGLLCFLVLAGVCALAQEGAPQTESSTEAPPTAAGAEQLQQLQVECTPASQAATLIGKHGCVAGKVFRVTTTKQGAIHLSLCPGHSDCSFHAVTLPRDRGKMDDLALLHGKLVAVVGDVRAYRGHPVIVVRQRDQLQVAADDATDFDAAEPRPIRGKNNPTPIPLPGLKHERGW